ncbi:hypothetical protein ACFWYW_36360 [Nonomuraea sp. NPDC059023]|uniref:hypothetical protein n=1 Tax=unclassified Nonomuraea TaxID=2593643 RepID=UPI003699B9E5
MALIAPLKLSSGTCHAPDNEFTVIDFETTGLKPGRVIEVGADRMRADGTVLRELST